MSSKRSTRKSVRTFFCGGGVGVGARGRAGPVAIGLAGGLEEVLDAIVRLELLVVLGVLEA